MKELNLRTIINEKNKYTKRAFSTVALPFKFLFWFFLIIFIMISFFVFNITDDIKKRIVSIMMLGLFLLFLAVINSIITYFVNKRIKKNLLTGTISIRVYKGIITGMKSEKTYSYVPYTRRRTIERSLNVQFDNFSDNVSVPLKLYAGFRTGDEIYMVVFNNERAFASVFPCNNYYFSDEKVLSETIYVNVEGE